MFENHGYNQVVANSGWQSILNSGWVLQNYWSLLHGSQANYIAILAGSYFGYTSENMVYLDYSSIMDLMDKKGLSWKGYFENYAPGSNGACNFNGNGYYCRNHNPFLGFTTVTGDSSRCQKVVNANNFMSDVVSDNLPHFSFYVPDNYNNSHDTALDISSSYLSHWLSTWYTPYLDTTWKDTLLMITWDEDGKDEYNHIVTMFKHPCLQSGTYNATKYDHYSITKFMEENWNLGSLGRNDTDATNFVDQFVMTCGSSSSHSGGGGKSDSGKDTKVSIGERGFLDLGANEKSSDFLGLFLVGVAFLTLPLIRLAYKTYHRKLSAEQQEKNSLIHYIHPNSVFSSMTTNYVQINDEYY